MVKPMTTNMFGLLEVKITARVRKRGFTPWKAWKKQWCNLKKTTSGLELNIYNTVPISDGASFPVQTVLIPETCVCCRTDSRTKSFAFGLFVDSKCRKAVMYLAGFSESNSQEWIKAIRRALDKRLNSVINIPEVRVSYTISLIDNAYSRAVGLFGVYGEMIVTSAGLIIYQPNGKNKPEDNIDRLCIGWNQILQFHLSEKRGSEDERKICIVHTNELFPNGPGQLRIFCIEAPKLLHAIMTQCNKILTTKLSTSPKQICDKDSANTIQNNATATEKNSDVSLRCTHEYSANKTTISPCHRMSRSEGDLCGYCDSDRDSGWSSCSPPEYNTILSSADQQSLTESNLRLSISSDDSSMVLKGKSADSLIFTGLLLNSVTKSKTDDTFETNDLVHSLPDITELVDNRRVSGVSIASGVYEEISENSARFYISKAPPLYEEPVFMPPPLPPRRRYASHTSGSDDGLEDDDCECSTPVTAKSLQSHFCNWEFKQQSEVLSNSTPDVNTIQDATIRKLSVSSLNEQYDQAYDNSKLGSPTFCRSHFERRCYSNEVQGRNKDLDVIPRCNTEPQKSLRPSQLCSPDAISNATINRKNKSRFDLTPIRNRLNSFIKSHLDIDSSPKSKSNFYNSLPRSMKMNKHTRKIPLKTKIHKDCTRSCELLDCEELDEAISENIAKSCELLDCVDSPSVVNQRQKAKSRDDIYEECNLKQKINEMNWKCITEQQNLMQNVSLNPEIYSNFKVLQNSSKDNTTSILTEPNFTQMRNDWVEHKIANLVDCDYVPMSPGIPSIISEENDDYMDMTGTKGGSVISSSITHESLKFEQGQI